MRKYYFILIFILFATQSFGQHKLDLESSLSKAQQNSSAAMAAKNRFTAAHWRYRMYKADYRPSLSLNGTFANLDRAFYKITLPDGSDAFRNRSQMVNNASLLLNQNIGLTGGSVFLSSGLQRIDLFNQQNNPISYLSNPISVGIQQSISGYNELHWKKRIEPLYYKEALQQYVQEVEDVNLQTVSLYFDVLVAESNYNTALQNKANNDTLYKIGQGRYRLGKIAENELLQLELNLLNTGLEIQQAGISLNAAEARFKSFIGLNANDSILLEIPVLSDTVKVLVSDALTKAKIYNPATLNMQRKKLEAEQNVAEAKGRSGLQGNITAQFGLNQNAYTLPGVYKNPTDQEQFLLGIQIPIVDWGKAKGTVEMAKAQQELNRLVIKQQQTDFEQDVMLQTAEFNLQGNQLMISKKANEVGERNYYIAGQRYLLGKIGITDLNIAQQNRDAARGAYLQVIRNYWISYYKLRKITLYDFEKNQALENEVKMRY